ncbi:MAG: YkgJ family cysteine cluster protein [Thermodesulfobacteriota bacterium]
MEEPKSPIKPAVRGQGIMPIHGTFNFKCGPGVSCYTRCCGDVTIVLTPYDILRLKNRLGVPSEDFIDQYTLPLTKSDSGIPVFVLKMGEGPEKRCPFVTLENGCSVYSERPWACRMYPLDTRDGEEGEVEFFITADPAQCRGLEEDFPLTVEVWEKEQGLDVYKEVEELFNQITSAQRIWGDHKLDGKVQNMILLACYNTERFRKFVFESNFLKLFDLSPEEIESLKTDDLALLKLGFRWLQFGLLGKSTLPIREEVIKAKEKELGITLPKDDGLWKNPETKDSKQAG